MIKINKHIKTRFWHIGIDLMLAVLVISGATALIHSHQTHADSINSTDFVITVKTNNTGVSNSTSFTIPTYSGSTYNYNVDCNDDGVADLTGQTGNATCTYTTAGTHTIRISGTFPEDLFRLR